MGYSKSALDEKYLRWFATDDSVQSLFSIAVRTGKIRGLGDFAVEFKYPITAIAGRNGSGKTTLLALAACAYHNSPKGYHLPGRSQPYYTFADFFIQSAHDIPVDGIRIRYNILHNSWRKTPEFPDGRGIGRQNRWKKRRGRWNNYDSRVHRNVVYLGIGRVVPHAERAVSKSYRGSFRRAGIKGWETEVRKIVGRILGRDYSGFEYSQHSKYRLALATHRGSTYSGFNMGAGEDALFEIISTVLDCPKGTLILIDEIELGLHEEAQAQLISELKNLCESRHIQVICTTHSARILEALPLEGRIFLQRIDSKTFVIPGISGEFATGELSGRPGSELDILVEDDAAELMVRTALPNDLRPRIDILAVGSATAVMRHAAARYLERSKKRPPICIILDGDQQSKQSGNINVFDSAIERKEHKVEAREWIAQRMGYLPGTAWPELWAMQSHNEESLRGLAENFGITNQGKLVDILESGVRAGKHNEFREASEKLQLDKGIVAHAIIHQAFKANPDEKKEIVDFIRNRFE